MSRSDTASYRSFTRTVDEETMARALTMMSEEFSDDPGAVQEFLAAVADNGGDLSTFLTKTHEPVSLDQFIEDDYFLGIKEGGIWPENRRIMNEIIDGGFVQVMFMGAIGYGKAQPLSARILTPTGWATMGSLRVGDLVIGKTGHPVPVTGVFPQGRRPVFRVAFNDGAETRCCDEHLWSVAHPSNNGQRRWQAIPLVQLRGQEKNSRGQRNWHTPVMDAAQFAGGPLPVAPYVLGALIANGSLHDGVRLSTADQPVLDRVAASIPAPLTVKFISRYDYRITGPRTGRAGANQLKNSLDELGLFGTSAGGKFVPSAYLFASARDRLDLFHGLMDGDGWNETNSGSVCYSSNSRQLRDDVVFLVRSLGGTTRQRQFVSASGKDHFHVQINMPPGTPAFWLERKLNAHHRTGKYLPSRMIDTITPDGEEECQCIMVGSEDQLYVTDDFVVTHNTTLSQILTLYDTYRLSCERFPQLKYGLLPTNSIYLAMLNRTEELAKNVTFGELRQMIEYGGNKGEGIPYFREEFKPDPGMKSALIFPRNIKIIPNAAYGTKLLGMNILGGIVDELNFMQTIEKSKKSRDGDLFNQAQEIVTTLVRRRKSRFQKQGKMPGIVFFVSSKGHPDDIMEKLKRENEDDQMTYIVDKALWDIKPADHFCGKRFSVEVGSDNSNTRVLAEGDVARPGNQVITVPIEFARDFRDDPEGSLRDLAGIATLSRRPYFWDREAIWKCGDAWSEAGHTHPLKNYQIDFLNIQPIWDEKWRPLKPDRPRVCHIDLGLTGDSAGLAIGYVDDIAFDRTRGDKGVVIVEEKPIVVFDCVLTIVPPKLGRNRVGEIEFEKIRQVLYRLRSMGLDIQYVSFDQFQSADSRQILGNKGFITFRRSVDGEKGLDLYRAFRSAVNQGRILSPPNPMGFKEMASVEEFQDPHRVDHTPENSKDTVDAMCAVYATLFKRRHLWCVGSRPRATPKDDHGENLPVRRGLLGDDDDTTSMVAADSRMTKAVSRLADSLDIEDRGRSEQQTRPSRARPAGGGRPSGGNRPRSNRR